MSVRRALVLIQVGGLAPAEDKRTPFDLTDRFYPFYRNENGGGKSPANPLLRPSRSPFYSFRYYLVLIPSRSIFAYLNRKILSLFLSSSISYIKT